ncbi:MAG: FKBP-type peptidyl-prolyl cis-trans isomerase, partial [Chloroflexi bacterium]|nr:FKBP-type peptidyl-prolyl cis-trans isomerase [Chloroflexota bacterium]
EGLATMQSGGKRRLRIAPSLAYGQQGLPGRVPPSSTVIFEIDLHEVVTAGATSTREGAQTPVLPPPVTPGASPGAGQ